MLLVTGGAGFIGSNVVASLNEAGRTDIAVADVLGKDGKWQNLRKRQLADFVPPSELMKWLDGRRLDAVIHMGAISETTARDGDAVMESNFRLSLALLDWCTAMSTPLIYASSAATYGDGAQGFSDDWQLPALRQLRPLNLYGWSKHLFDLAIVDRASKGQKLPPQWAGLKFFNVFGPNEYHKGEMMSLVAKRFDEAKAGNPVRLFKSHRPDIADGDQRRDFLHVDDAVGVVRWLLESPRTSGIFNVGTGQASSFRQLISAMFAALGRPPDIQYIAMPESIRDSYQYFTQASVDNLRRAGYNAGFTPIEDGISRYVSNHLDQTDRYR
jgi:ADP-L-glycero-D-manno-heptose 6-epimerase